MSTSNFIIYLEKNPKLFAIAKSKMCIGILKILENRPLDLESIRLNKQFEHFEVSDLKILLNLLNQLKLIDKTKTGIKTIYSINENTTEFLRLYSNAKKDFTLK